MKNQDVIDIDEVELESDLPNQDTLESENQLNVEPPKNKSRVHSNVWEYFINLGIVNGKPKAKCNGCAKEFCAGGNKYGVSTLRRHMGICLHLKYKYQDVGDALRDNEGKVRNRPLNQKVLREKIAMAIVRHDLPLSFVEYDGIWDVLTYCNSSVKRFSRNTSTTDVHKLYLAKKENLKKTLANIPSRICLTSDCWTACTSEGYISLTAHFIDVDWRLNSLILSFADFPPPHNGVELAQKVFGLLREWGIDKKIFSITLDNASSNDNMQDILRQKLNLQKSLLCKGEFFHIRCSAHILNLIVQEGLKVACGALHNIRESVKYVKGSEARARAFDACVEQIGLQKGVHLKLDVSTRWNSTYLMLNSALKYRRAFDCLSLSDKNYRHCPSEEDWLRGEKMCEFLRPFFNITKLMSGSSYPTSNLYFMQVWKIEKLLVDNENSEDDVVKDMVKRMKIKFDKYWKEYSLILALGAVLDPRIKLAILQSCYEKLDLDKTPESEKMIADKVEIVKKNLIMLFEQYSKPLSNSSREHDSYVPSQSILEKDLDAFTPDQDFIMFASQVATKTGKSQLDIYLDESTLQWDHFANLDILQFWKKNTYRFPELALMASDILSIPITTVASESAFSIGSRILSKYRSCLLPKNVQAAICLRNWNHGFIDEEEDEDSTSNATVSRVDLNSDEDDLQEADEH